MEFREIKNPLTTQKYTKVFCESDTEFKEGANAPSTFAVCTSEGSNVLQKVEFQAGPIKESGINGVMGEDLILMVLTRLEYFQKTKFKCKENEMAIQKLEEALMWLRKRTTEREMKNIEGTHEI